MRTDFVLFGPAHLAILAAIGAVAVGLTWIGRKNPAVTRPVRLILGFFLLINELVWYGFKLNQEGWRFPEGLPLQLCDLSLWMTVFAALTLNQWIYELAYFAGLGGAAMALLTPELWAPMLSYPTIYFFMAHGGIVVVIVFITATGLARPRPGCVLRAMILVNGFAAFVGLFNAIFRTNYMYLCRKPGSASLLDFFGPWPWYILGGELAAAAIFYLLWLPFKLATRRQQSR
jgi:hypothetical integral membrane protein (TIGR02206 family)